MKRIWNHPEPLDDSVVSWGSSSQLNDTPQFREWLEREFPQGAAEMKDEEESGVSRRNFLRLMGASTALAGFGMAACRKPTSYLIPFTDNVEWVVPGKPLYYASTMLKNGWSWPVLISTVDGRPTHLSGNSLHPEAGSALDHFGIAEVLQMYDPDRSAHYLAKEKQSSKQEFDAWFADFLGRIGDGSGVAFLLGESSTPTETRLLKKIQERFAAAQFFRYEAVASQGEKVAKEKVFGSGTKVIPRLSEVRRILSLDCDFLEMESPYPLAARDFARIHKPENKDGSRRSAEEMARLYVVENAFSLTGGQADHRLRLSYAGILRFALALAHKLIELVDDSAMLEGAVGQIQEKNAALFAHKIEDFQQEWLHECAVDLLAAKGEAIVLAGSRHGTALHLLVEAINQVLQAPRDVLAAEEGVKAGQIAELYSAIDSGKVKTLVSLTIADPVYDAPRAAKSFQATLEEKSIELIHFGLQVNATARQAAWHIPAAHWLEGWNDGLSPLRAYSIAQPTMEPLTGGEDIVSFLLRFLPDEVTTDLAEDDDPARHAVYQTFAQFSGISEERNATEDSPLLSAWEDCLRNGFFAAKEQENATSRPVTGGELAEAWREDVRELPRLEKEGSGLEVVFAADHSMLDGRYANNGWMQEAPDPITKLTWDNAILMSPITAIELSRQPGLKDLAKDLGVDRALIAVSGEDGEHYEAVEDNVRANIKRSPDLNPPVIALTINGVRQVMPVLLAYGHADYSVTIHLGYGRKKAGRVADGYDEQGVGFDVNPWRVVNTPYVSTIQAVEATEKGELDKYEFALTSEHHTMYGRGLVVESPLETKDKDHGRGYLEHGYTTKAWIDAHAPDSPSIYRAEDWKGQPLINDELHQWGMVIDLTSCTGCNACLTACQSENNIPIVGKDQVRIGRDMHWIRMDRYFSNRTKARETHSEHGEHNSEVKNPDPGNPEMLVQPVACQQCEYAPCETVCPVNATVHSEDGLNLMAYNRCIGTRYCANNCPYKARRFNFFDYNKRPIDQLYRGPFATKEGLAETTLKLQKNPNVTVRMRGVMEKCTYCIQRIQEAKIDAKGTLQRQANENGGNSTLVTVSNEELRIPSNTLRVACQDACPSESVVFGNLLDKNDEIYQYKKLEQVGQTRQVVASHPRDYEVLDYIGARPRTSYLARVRNLNLNIRESLFRGDASVSLSRNY